MPLKEFSLQYTLENASFRAYKNTIEILNLRKISIASAHFVTKPLSYVEREETQEQRAIPSIIFANRYFQGPKISVALHFLSFWSNERTNVFIDVHRTIALKFLSFECVHYILNCTVCAIRCDISFFQQIDCFLAVIYACKI